MAYNFKFKDELVECFDEDGITRMHPRYRSEVCTEGTRRWHGVANVWLVNRDGMILCSQRSPAVQNNPNKWQTYAGGHVKAGTTFLETVVKELHEELGVKVLPDQLYLIEKANRRPRMHVSENYVFLYEDRIKDLHFGDGEVIEAKWYAYVMYVKDKEKSPDKWCNGLSEENYLKIQQWLKTQN